MFKRVVASFLALTFVLCLIPNFSITTSAATGYDRGYKGGMAGDGKIVAHGLDVSAWQESGLNFQNFVNAGYDYVILRCGTSVRKDVCFEEFYRNAKAVGLDVGCYFYSYATTAAEARAEAYDVLEYIKGKKFEYPIYFDFEDPTQVDLSYDLSAQICRAFMDVLKDNGYLAGLYSMSWILNRSWVTSSGINGLYEGWVAHVYSDANNTGITSNEYNIYKDRYCSVYGMHQYSFTTYVNGVGPFDANVAYKDYPAICKAYGFNGYNSDTTGPVITDVRYSNVSASGYTISCTVKDDSGVDRVAFPTWTVANAQDDLPAKWDTTQLGTKNGDRYTFRVNASDHNNEGGMYATHIYAFDRAGNKSSLSLQAVEVRNDTVNPVISDVRISELSSAGYTVTCTATDDWGIEKVAFPVWTVANNQDDIPANWANTQLGARDGDTFTFRVNASDHNNEGGYYATHIYAYDCAGNKVCYTMDINVKNDDVAPVVSDVVVSEITSEGYKVTCKATDDYGINSVAFPTWTVNNGQDDLPEQFMKTQLGTRDGDTFTFYVKASDHNNEQGEYITHIYAVDYAGNTFKYLVSVDVKDLSDVITLTSSATYSINDTYLKGVKAQTTVSSLLTQFENETLKVLDKDGNELNSTDKVGTGATVNLYNGTDIVDTVTVVVFGDVDGNAVVDTTDYMRVKQAFLRNFTLSETEKKAADVDENKIVDSTDGMRIKSHFLGTYDLFA